MRKHILLIPAFALLAMCALAPASPAAHAQAKPQTPPGAAPFVPTSGWLVGPAAVDATLAGRDLGLPCVMANQYNNGFFFRFSVRAGTIPALAVDTHRNAFAVGDGFPVEMTVDSAFSQTLSATAHSAGVFLTSVPDGKALHDALHKGKYMTLTIGDIAMRFALPGLENGLARAAQCQRQATQGQAPSPTAAAAAVSPDYKNLLAPYAASAHASPAAPIAHPGNAAAQPSPDEDDSARIAGLDSMLDNAAQALARLAPASGAVRPYGMQGTKIVPPPAARPSAAAISSSGPKAASAPPPPARSPRDILENASLPVSSPDTQDRPMRWRAAGGANLHEVLDVWTSGAHVRLVWEAEHEFAVPQPLTVQGTLEDAVRQLLEQYGQNSVRPVARLFVDPAFQQKVLLVEEKR